MQNVGALLRQSQSGAGRLFAQQPVFKLRSATKVKTRCVQEENKEEAALDALLDPERNTMLQMAAADVASSSKLRTASEKQVCRAGATDYNAAHDAVGRGPAVRCSIGSAVDSKCRQPECAHAFEV